MSSNESAAYQIMRSLDVDYVLIIFGGVIGYSGDDINKFLWMVRIAEGEHPKDIRVSVRRHHLPVMQLFSRKSCLKHLHSSNQCFLFTLTPCLGRKRIIACFLLAGLTQRIRAQFKLCSCLHQLCAGSQLSCISRA